MANTPLRAESALVTFPNQVPPMPAVARILSRYDRAKLEAFVSVAIDLLDVLDGDPDLEEEEREDDDPAEADDEPEEDDHSGQCDEDGINTVHPACGRTYLGAGCPISDANERSLQDVTLNPDASGIHKGI